MAIAAGAIRAGGAFVELFVNKNPFVRGLRAASAGMERFSNRIRETGMELVRVGLLVNAPVLLASKAFSDFEQQMARVQALSGAVGADFQRLVKRAEDLGRSTIFSAKEAAEGMAFFAQAGFEADKIYASIGPTLNMATAGLLDIAEASEIVVKVMASSGLEAKQVGRAVDVLTKAFTSANTNLHQLAEGFKFLGPLAKVAGIQFEETVAAIQLLSNAGIQAALSGTTLRGVLLSMLSPTKQAEKTMRRLGISVTDSAGKIVGLAEIVDRVNYATRRMSNARRLDVLGRIFPTRAISGMSELLARGGDEIRKFTRRLEEHGTAARIAGVILNTLSGDFVILTSAIKGLGIEVGRVLSPAIRALLKSAIDLINVVSDWARKNGALLVTLVSVAAGVLAFGVGLLAVAVVFKAIVFAMGFLLVLWSVFTFAVTASWTILSAVVPVLLAVVGAVLLLSSVLMGFGSDMQRGMSFVDTFFKWLLRGTRYVATAIVEIIASSKIGDAIRLVAKEFKESLTSVGVLFLNLLGIVQSTLDGIKDALATGDLKTAVEIFWAGFRIAQLQGMAFLEKEWARWKMVFVEVFHSIVDQVKILWEYLMFWMSEGWRKMLLGVKIIWELTVGSLRWIVGNLLASLLGVVKSIFVIVNDNLKALDYWGLVPDALIESGEAAIQMMEDAQRAALDFSAMGKTVVNLKDIVDKAAKERELAQQMHENELEKIGDASKKRKLEAEEKFAEEKRKIQKKLDKDLEKAALQMAGQRIKAKANVLLDILKKGKQELQRVATQEVLGFLKHGMVSVVTQGMLAIFKRGMPDTFKEKAGAFLKRLITPEKEDITGLEGTTGGIKGSFNASRLIGFQMSGPFKDMTAHLRNIDRNTRYLGYGTGPTVWY